VGFSARPSFEESQSDDISLIFQGEKSPDADRGVREPVLMTFYSSDETLADLSYIAHLHGKFPCSADTPPIIDIDELNIARGALTMVLGPVGCGKSLLLKAFLGELDSFDGMVWINNTGIAYCDQSPWIPNDTVRNIILGSSDWDAVWYQKVIKACALEQDITTWPDGENTTAGSQGISMSGGQKQRLVRTIMLFQRPILTPDNIRR
jgi:ATP-binding cassette, subfamily C (CFTR/MRP), member 1